MSRMICGACGVYLECEENGVLYADEEHGNFAKCDLYQCPKCGNQVVSGFGSWLMPDTAKRMLQSYIDNDLGILRRDEGYNKDVYGLTEGGKFKDV